MNHDSAHRKVFADIRKGVIAPCYLLYGDEDYLIGETLRGMIDLMLPEGDRSLNLVYMDGGNEDMDRLLETLLTPPLIPGRKIVVLRDSHLLSSKQSASDLIRKIRDNLNRDPRKAARDFMAFLRLTDWKLDDFKNEKWKTIGEDQWEKIAGGDEPGDRDKWIPVVLDFCEKEGLSDKEIPYGEEELIRVLSSDLPEGNCLIITAVAVDKRKRLYRVLAERGIILHFGRSRGEEKLRDRMFETVQDFLRRQGRSIDPEAIMVLGRKTGFDLRKSMTELEKIIAYIGERRRVEVADVEEIAGKTKEDSVFELTAAITERNKEKAFSVLRDLLEQGVHPLVVLSMITREMRFLLHASLLIATGGFDRFDPRMDFSRFQQTVLPALKEWATAGGNGIELTSHHPYVVYNAFRFSGRFSGNELIRNLEALLEADLALKTTGQDPRIVMERLIIQICHN